MESYSSGHSPYNGVVLLWDTDLLIHCSSETPFLSDIQESHKYFPSPWTPSLRYLFQYPSKPSNFPIIISLSISLSFYLQRSHFQELSILWRIFKHPFSPQSKQGISLSPPPSPKPLSPFTILSGVSQKFLSQKWVSLVPNTLHLSLPPMKINHMSLSLPPMKINHMSLSLPPMKINHMSLTPSLITYTRYLPALQNIVPTPVTTDCTALLRDTAHIMESYSSGHSPYNGVVLLGTQPI